MYIKQIRKQNKIYYILCVCDATTSIWASRFITSEMAKTLVEVYDVSIKEIKTKN